MQDTIFAPPSGNHTTVLILNAADVRQALPMSQAIAAMKQAFAAFSSGQAVVPSRTHLAVPALEAMCAGRTIAEIRIFCPSPSAVEALISEFAHMWSRGVRLMAATSAREAIDHADIICATTTAATPVFDDADVAVGTQIN